MRHSWTLLAVFLLLSACKTKKQEVTQVFILQGETMGTYFNVRYSSREPTASKVEIDSLLIDLNQEVSTYIPTSTISLINSQHQESLSLNRDTALHFINNYLLSEEMYDLSDHYFDPTLNPLVNFWGFGYEERASAQKDTSLILELLQLVSFEKWNHSESSDDLYSITKPAGASLDFSAIAKGYGVDLVGEYLSSKGIENWFVDIGGEVRSLGSKPANKPWVIGVNHPSEKAGVKEADYFLNISDRAVATSGNYRNYYTENGVTFSHTINPFSGMTERSNLLSASIVHKSCARADAAATACMVMGLEKSKTWISSLSDYEAFLIFRNQAGEVETWKSTGFDFILN